MSQENLGKWVRIVDHKWRLVVPASIRKELGQEVLLKINAEGCIEVEKSSPKNIDSSATIFYPSVRTIKRGRITIPPWLRNSISFYLGRKVMIVSQNGHCKIWPWR